MVESTHQAKNHFNLERGGLLGVFFIECHILMDVPYFTLSIFTEFSNVNLSQRRLI